MQNFDSDEINFKVIFAIKFNNPAILTKTRFDCIFDLYNQKKCQVSLPLQTGIVLNLPNLSPQQKLQIEFVDHNTQQFLGYQSVPIPPLIFEQDEVEILDLFSVTLDMRNIVLKGSYYIIFINQSNQLRTSSSTYTGTPSFLSPKNADQNDFQPKFDPPKARPLDPLEFSLSHTMKENVTQSVKKSITPSRKKTDLILKDLSPSIQYKNNIPSRVSKDFTVPGSARKINQRQETHRNQISFSKLPQRQSKEKYNLYERTNTSFTLNRPTLKTKQHTNISSDKKYQQKKKEIQNISLTETIFKNEICKLVPGHLTVHRINTQSKNNLTSTQKNLKSLNFQ